MDNTHNKSEIVHLLSLTFQKYQITMVQYDNDADTSIVRVTLIDATDDSTEVMVQVWEEDVGLLIILVHHCSNANHPLFHHIKGLSQCEDDQRSTL